MTILPQGTQSYKRNATCKHTTHHQEEEPVKRIENKIKSMWLTAKKIKKI